MESLVVLISDLLSNWGVFSYMFVFLFAAFESIAFLGLLVPGVVAVTALGFVSASGGLDFWSLALVISAGAYVGDYISFWLGGGKGATIVARLSDRFAKDKGYIEIGEAFFRKYGDKSVLVGRFVTVVRPFISFVAGVFRMDGKKFLFWNALGAITWSVAYLSLGYFFGYAWELVVGEIFGISLIILLALLVLVVTYFWRKKAMDKIRQ